MYRNVQNIVRKSIFTKCSKLIIPYVTTYTFYVMTITVLPREYYTVRHANRGYNIIITHKDNAIMYASYVVLCLYHAG